MPFAARLGIIKVPQGQSAMAVAARSSEQVVLGSAGLQLGSSLFWAAEASSELDVVPELLSGTVGHDGTDSTWVRKFY